MEFKELQIYIKEKQNKEKEEYNQQLDIAYKNALWQRIDAKEFPNHKDIFIDVKKEDEKPQTVEEQADALKSWKGALKRGKK